VAVEGGSQLWDGQLDLDLAAAAAVDVKCEVKNGAHHPMGKWKLPGGCCGVWLPALLLLLLMALGVVVGTFALFYRVSLFPPLQSLALEELVSCLLAPV